MEPLNAIHLDLLEEGGSRIVHCLVQEEFSITFFGKVYEDEHPAPHSVKAIETVKTTSPRQLPLYTQIL